MWGDGLGFTPDEVPAGAQVLFVAQNPGETEEIQGRPLIGVTGQLLRRQLVPRYLGDMVVGYGNMLKCRAQDAVGRHTNTLPAAGSAEWQAAVRHCWPYLEATLARVPEALVVPMGDHAIRAFTGLRGKVLHLRGTLVRGWEKGHQ